MFFFPDFTVHSMPTDSEPPQYFSDSIYIGLGTCHLRVRYRCVKEASANNQTPIPPHLPEAWVVLAYVLPF